MEPRQIEEELRFALQELYREAIAHERFNRNPNEMAGKCDTFEHDWSENLEKSRGQKLHKAEELAVEIAQLKEKKAGQHENAMTADAIKPFDPLTRDLMYNATDRREQENRPPNAELLKTVLGPAQQRINERSDQLLKGMQTAVDAVRNGQDPDLSFLNQERQKEKQGEDEAAKLKMRPGY